MILQRILLVLETLLLELLLLLCSALHMLLYLGFTHLQLLFLRNPSLRGLAKAAAHLLLLCA